MDTITTAIIVAVSAGAISGLTDTTKTAIIDGYHKLKDLLIKKHGASSDVALAIDKLEAKPELPGRKAMLAEEITAINAEQDEEMLAAAKQILTLVQPQQAAMGKFIIHQDHAIIQGQNIGNYQHVTQHFRKMPKA